MEFGFPLESEALVLPQGTPFVGTTPTGPGYQWQSRYGIVGLNQNLDRRVVCDGMNEKGLVASLLYLPGFAEYEPFDPKQSSQTIGAWELPTLVLSLCRTISEVKKLLPSISVAQQMFPGMPNFFLPVHLYVADRNGAVLIVEFVTGKRHMYDHPLGCLTNSPPLDWQLINLSNYINLSPYNASNLSLKGYLVKGVGQGTGMLGLPGDWTPPSRFVRAALFSSWALPPNNGIETVKLGFHILNTFDIFEGVILERPTNPAAAPPGKEQNDTTQWVVVHNLTQKESYIRTYNGQQIEKIDLNKIDFSGSTPMRIRLKNEFAFIDITDRQTPLSKDL